METGQSPLWRSDKNTELVLALSLRPSRNGILETEIRKAEPQHALVMLAGELDTSNVVQLYEELADLTRDAVRHIAINLVELEFVDSTGLSTLIAAHKRAEALGGELIPLSSQSGHTAPVRGDRHRHLSQHPTIGRRVRNANLKSIQPARDRRLVRPPCRFAFVESADTLCTEDFRVARGPLGPVEDTTMTTDHAAQPWALRSTLIAVGDLERSVAFYGELGPFAVIARDDAIAVLGDASPESVVLILRETRGRHQTRHGPQSLGLRSMTFNVGSLGELDRIESFLRSRDLFTDRRPIADGASDLLRGRDPDNLPLVFVSYTQDTIGPDYYESAISLYYSIDA